MTELTNIIFFDTETTGLPLWNEPSESPEQPHVLQYAGILTDNEGNEVERYTSIVKPDGWVIPEDAIKIHGITMERAMDEGIPAADALEQFLTLWVKAQLRVGHNEMFDRRMVRIAIKRHGLGFGPHGTQEERDMQSDHWNAAPDFCTCWSAKYDMGVKKLPKLGEALKHYTGEEQAAAHTAIGDAQDCMKIFWALKARGAVPSLEEIIAKKQAKADAKAAEKSGRIAIET